jgi:acetyltransferase
MSEQRLTKKKDLEKIFYPQSVAVVGANRVPGTVPSDLVQNLLKSDFQGIIFPVSPKERFISGLKTYKYVIDIDDPVDLAILVFPSSVCHLALEQCGQKGIKSAVIISAGFSEVGGMGVEREENLVKIAEKYGISFIGPNCLGVINTDLSVNLNASFARQMPSSGSIGFISQSGALCTAVLDYAQAKHIGFSKFVSFGNKADIDEIDLLYYLGDDPGTKVILMYLEEISQGKALMQAASDVIVNTGKPILAIKSGRTNEGASAAASHTGSLAGSDKITEAAFAQCGIIRCDDIDEMFIKAIALAYQPLPENKRIAIITNAGGPGVLTTDATIANGLQLAQFSEETTVAFRKSLPNTANINNPVDIIGDARVDRYHIAVSKALEDKNVDGVFVILTPQSMTDIEAIAREICKISALHRKPLYTSFMGEADVARGIDILQRNEIPHYSLPESMSMAYTAAWKFSQNLKQSAEEPEIFRDVDKQKAHALLNEALKNGKQVVPETTALSILGAYGLPVVEGHLVRSEDETAVWAEKLGFPLVMKIVSEDIIHKYDTGGVILNINSVREAKAAYGKIIRNIAERRPDAGIDGVFVRKMIPAGEEVILGMKRDVTFDAVLMFGLGGIFVELFMDVSFRITPVSKTTAEAMIEETKASALLNGFRGRPMCDVKNVITNIQRVSQLVIDCPQIRELDINPLIVMEDTKGSFVADVKIML